MFLLALAARMHGISENSIWLDEGWRVSLALNSPRTRDISFLKLIGLMIDWFGRTEWAIRLPSAVFGALCVPAMYCLSRMYLRPAQSVLLSLVICFSPFHLAYSSEAAGYAMACFFVLVFAISMKVWQRRASVWPAMGMLLSAYFICWENIYYLIFIFLSFVAFQFYEQRAKHWLFLGSIFLLLLLLMTPNIEDAIAIGRSMRVEMPNKNFTDVIGLPPAILSAMASGPFPSYFSPNAFRILRAADSNILLGASLLLASAGIACAIVWGAMLVLIETWRKKIAEPIFISVILFGVFLCLLKVILDTSHARYFLPLFPIFALLVLFALSSLAKWRENSVVLLLLIWLMLSMVVAVLDRPGRSFKPDARKVSMEILGQCKAMRPGAVFVIVPEMTELAMYDFYLNGRGCRVISQPRYEEFYKHGIVQALASSPEAMAKEDSWFRDVIDKSSGTREMETLYIVSERQIERAESLAKINSLKSYHKQTKTIDKIRLIRLDRTGVNAH